MTSHGTYLDRLMTELGLSNHELAKSVGTGRQSIWKLRTGYTRMLPGWAVRLAPYLGVTWQELVEGAPLPVDPGEARLIAAFRALDEERRQGLLTVAEGMTPTDRPENPSPDEAPPAAPRPADRPPPRPIKGGNAARSPDKEDCGKNVALRRLRPVVGVEGR